MPKLSMVLKHRVSRDEAMKWARDVLRDVGNKPEHKIQDVNITCNHNAGTFQFKTMELSASGTFTVTDTHVKIEAELPLPAALLRNRIESTIRERAVKLLA